MKATLIILAILLIVIIITLFIRGFNSRKGMAPGLIDGKLTQCSIKPNCVCSDIKKDTQHYISPLILPNNSVRVKHSLIKDIIKDMGGVLVLEKENYFSFNFTSTLFGFVDDVEVRLDSNNGAIHFRSASRVGTSDMGVNRKRIDKLKELIKKQVSNEK